MATSIPSPHHSMVRRTMINVLVALMIAVSVGLLVAWSQGVFQRGVSYWIDHGHDCGQVSTGPMAGHLDRTEVDRAIACFVAAYAHCRPAFLTRIVRGVDTSDTDTFVVEPRDGGGCDVGLHSSFFMASGNITTIKEAQCAGMTSTNGELTISGCQEFGDFTLPQTYLGF
jgi:hypothetical protein